MFQIGFRGNSKSKQWPQNSDKVFERKYLESIWNPPYTKWIFHLSRLTTDSRSDITPIDDYFLDESLLSISTMPWFANIVNFLVSGHLPAHWSTQDKRKFLNEVKNFYWDDPYLFKYCPNQIFQRCIPDNEVSSVIKFCHSKACEGHFSSRKTTAKILQSGFYWPTMFKDSHAFCKTCENYQKFGSISKHHMMPLIIFLSLRSLTAGV